VSLEDSMGLAVKAEGFSSQLEKRILPVYDI
jgi:hypothetical protein